MKIFFKKKRIIKYQKDINNIFYAISLIDKWQLDWVGNKNNTKKNEIMKKAVDGLNIQISETIERLNKFDLINGEIKGIRSWTTINNHAKKLIQKGINFGIALKVFIELVPDDDKISKKSESLFDEIFSVKPKPKQKPS